MTENEFFIVGGFVLFGVIVTMQWLTQSLLRELRENDG